MKLDWLVIDETFITCVGGLLGDQLSGSFDVLNSTFRFVFYFFFFFPDA